MPQVICPLTMVISAPNILRSLMSAKSANSSRVSHALGQAFVNVHGSAPSCRGVEYIAGDEFLLTAPNAGTFGGTKALITRATSIHCGVELSAKIMSFMRTWSRVFRLILHLLSAAVVWSVFGHVSTVAEASQSSALSGSIRSISTLPIKVSRHGVRPPSVPCCAWFPGYRVWFRYRVMRPSLRRSGIRALLRQVRLLRSQKCGRQWPQSH